METKENDDMADTIFFSGKLKRGRSPLEVFDKIQKKIKNKGPTKDWVCTIDEEEEQLCIHFPDGKSESFVLSFDEKGNFSDCCKVYFPLEDELFEEGKSEFKALLSALYAARTSFSKIEISDDYGLASEYWSSKKYKIRFRELTPEELERVQRLFDQGNTKHEDMIMAMLAEDMGMSVENLQNYSNPETAMCNNRKDIMKISGILDVYLYESTAYGKKGRVCDIPDWEYYDLGDLAFSVWAFIGGVEEIFFEEYREHYLSNPKYKRVARTSKSAQVMGLFDREFYPKFEREKDKLNRCILAIRYFISIFEYLGFTYVGRTDTPTVEEQIMARYGDIKGKYFIKYLCAWQAKMRKLQKEGGENSQDIMGKCYHEMLISMEEQYGSEFCKEWRAFRKEYLENYNYKIGMLINREIAKGKLIFE